MHLTSVIGLQYTTQELVLSGDKKSGFSCGTVARIRGAGKSGTTFAAATVTFISLQRFASQVKTFVAYALVKSSFHDINARGCSNMPSQESFLFKCSFSVSMNVLCSHWVRVFVVVVALGFGAIATQPPGAETQL